MVGTCRGAAGAERPPAAERLTVWPISFKVKVKVYYPTLTAPLKISPSSDDSTASKLTISLVVEKGKNLYSGQLYAIDERATTFYLQTEALKGIGCWTTTLDVRYAAAIPPPQRPSHLPHRPRAQRPHGP